VAQSVTVTFLHRPAAVFVAGQRSSLPRYRIVPSVPEGQYNEASRRALVKDVTDAVVRAHGGKFEDVAPLVWVFPTEIPEGQWGSRGVILAALHSDCTCTAAPKFATVPSAMTRWRRAVIDLVPRRYGEL
jgi:phenylpyruvate tautomerase PptA (4-oxalocrotonate tautomerase family)